jgi:hypothetical protein
MSNRARKFSNLVPKASGDASLTKQIIDSKDGADFLCEGCETVIKPAEWSFEFNDESCFDVSSLNPSEINELRPDNERCTFLLGNEKMPSLNASSISSLSSVDKLVSKTDVVRMNTVDEVDISGSGSASVFPQEKRNISGEMTEEEMKEVCVNDPNSRLCSKKKSSESYSSFDEI